MSTGDLVGIGVIGAGSIAEAHLAAYAKNASVRIVAIADAAPGRAAAAATKFGAAASYESAAELLANPDVDAVSICTRNDTHAELAIAALEAGKHVLVEKPLARTAAEAQSIADVAERTGLVAQVGFVRRFAPSAVLLKRMIDDGELGAIYYAKASALRRAGNPGGWFANKAVSGGGPLIDLGPHFIDLMWYLMGKPKVAEVTAATFDMIGNRANITNLDRYRSADYNPDDNSVEDLATAFVRFENGAVLTFDTSYSLHGRDEVAFRIFGDKGGAELEPKLKVVTEKHDTIVEIDPIMTTPGFDFAAAFGAEIDSFVGAVRGEHENMAPVEDGVQLARILDAIYQSAAAAPYTP